MVRITLQDVERLSEKPFAIFGGYRTSCRRFEDISVCTREGGVNKGCFDDWRLRKYYTSRDSSIKTSIRLITGAKTSRLNQSWGSRFPNTMKQYFNHF